MQKKSLTIVRNLFFLGLAIFMVWFPTRNITPEKWDQIKHALLNANYLLLLPVILLFLFSHWVRAMRWKILIEPLGYKPPTLHLFYATLFGYLVNLIIPRLGEIAKCSILGTKDKVALDQLLGTIITERLFDLLCLLLVFTLTILIQVDVVGSYVLSLYHKLPTYPTWAYLLLAGIVAAGLFLLYWLLRTFRNNPFIRKISAFALGIWTGIKSISTMRRKWAFLFQTILIWVLYLSCAQLGLYAIRETAHLGIATALSILSIGSIAMIVTPGGIGGYPWSVQQTLHLYGIADNIGWASGWLLWTIPTFIVIIGGSLSFFLLAGSKKRSSRAEATTIQETT